MVVIDNLYQHISSEIRNVLMWLIFQQAASTIVKEGNAEQTLRLDYFVVVRKIINKGETLVIDRGRVRLTLFRNRNNRNNIFDLFD